jgi:chemotaxis methyl-accepting protein methylase
MTPSDGPQAKSAAGPTLAALRAYVLEVSRDLDPGSRYVRELLEVLDASADLDDYLVRLQDARRTALFRTDGSLVSQGERGYSWLDDETWAGMDVFERTLANLVTGETRMLWAGDGARDFARFAEAVAAAGLGPALSACCVPCSTGKEVYSLVIAGLESGLDVRALGVDLQAAYVVRARSGRLVPHHRDWDCPAAAGYLERAAGATVVRPRVLERCSFVTGDVLTGPLPPGPFDLVSSRNLLGYFRGPTLEAAWRNVAARVRGGGLLLLDPFVTDSAQMAAVPCGLAAAGFVRMFPDASYYRAPPGGEAGVVGRTLARIPSKSLEVPPKTLPQPNADPSVKYARRSSPDKSE